MLSSWCLLFSASTPMPITVEAHVQYLTVQVPQMRGVDHDALVFVHALKGRPFTNYAWVRAPDGTWKQINPQRPEVASEIFIDWAVKQILVRTWDGPICLVPVPNKSALASARTVVPDSGAGGATGEAVQTRRGLRAAGAAVATRLAEGARRRPASGPGVIFGTGAHAGSTWDAQANCAG